MDIKLLIVEDEPIIAERLANIDWREAGVVLTHIFSNAGEAWNYAQKNHPDILISDIQMPGENGLAFAKRLKSRLPMLKVIFLTAYDILEYTKSAIEIGVLAYLLKPINKDKLISTVKGAAESVIAERRNATDTNIANVFRSNKFLLKNYFLSSVAESSNTKELYTMFEIPSGDTLCSAITVKFYNRQDDCSFDFANIRMLLSSNDYFILPFYEYNIFTFFVKFKFSLDGEHALNQCIGIAEKIKDYLDFNYSDGEISYSIGIGEIVNSLPELTISYESSVNCLEYSFYIGTNQVIYCRDVEPSTEIIKYKEYISSCILSLKVGNTNAAKDSIKALFITFKNENISITAVQRICLELIVNISTALLQIGHDPNYLFNKLDIWACLKSHTTLDTLEKLVHNLIDTSISQINDTRYTKKKNLVAEVIEYIDQNFTEPISLESLAKKFFVSTCYLSTIFKQETNMTFKAYIKMLKINKAKEMLTNTDMTIKAIANELGFNSSKYFSKTFHDETGFMPSEYRIKTKSYG